MTTFPGSIPMACSIWYTKFGNMKPKRLDIILFKPNCLDLVLHRTWYILPHNGVTVPTTWLNFLSIDPHGVLTDIPTNVDMPFFTDCNITWVSIHGCIFQQQQPIKNNTLWISRTNQFKSPSLFSIMGQGDKNLFKIIIWFLPIIFKPESKAQVYNTKS